MTQYGLLIGKWNDWNKAVWTAEWRMDGLEWYGVEQSVTLKLTNAI